MISVNDLFSQGISNMKLEHSSAEAGKEGTLRAGMTGCIVHGDQILGTCPKKAYLRMVGVELDDYSSDRELMFAAGHSNEDIWAHTLLAAKEPGISLKRESEVPIEWELDSGRKITGRPDIVVLENDVPKLLIELKLVSSLWTARDVGIKLEPKVGHLLQAGHYAWQLGVPGELWYTSRADFAIGGWATKHFPDGSPRLEYGYSSSPGNKKITREEYEELPANKRNCEARKTLPFKQGFEIQWTAKGQLVYRPVGHSGTWNHTLITQDGIKKFYELVDQLPHSTKLPGCVSSLMADGSRMSYALSDYCPLNKLDKEHKCAGINKRMNFGEWMELVHSFIANKTAEMKEI